VPPNQALQQTTGHLCSVLAFLLAAAPSLCCALEDTVTVTPEQAKELGLEIKAKASGKDAVFVVLEFETNGKLKGYSRAELEMKDEGKLLLRSTLREDKSPSGRVVVSFAADRTKLSELTMKVVIEYTDGGAGRVGYVLPVKEFVDLKKLR
jgi:hypothetical protein